MMVTVLGPDSVFTDIFSVMVGTVVKSRAKFRSNAGLTGVGGWVLRRLPNPPHKYNSC